MQFSTAFALIFHACSASGALADPASAATGGDSRHCTTLSDCAGYRDCGSVGDQCKCKNGKCRQKWKDCKTYGTRTQKWPCPEEKECVVKVKDNVPKTGKWGRCRLSRRAYLEGKFPDLGPLASEATVAAYTAKENTMTRSSGIVLDVWRGTDDATALSWFASTESRIKTSAGQKISKSEATLLCVTKCEEVLPGCTLFRLNEYATVDGEVYHQCFFYGDATATAQFPVETPFSNGKDSEGNDVTTTAMVVFHKGEELALPDFHGCDVPLSSEALFPLITCRVEKFAADDLEVGVLSSGCEDLLPSASADFEDYIWPSVQCTFMAVGYNGDKLNQCFYCLAAAGEANNGCGSGFCGEDSFITKACSDACPTEDEWGDECVSKIATAFLCRYGAAPSVWGAEVAAGGCMNSDTPGHFTYLADSGNGDYKCP